MSGGRHGVPVGSAMASRGAVEPSCMAALGISEELNALHSRVLDTLVEVQAPAMRRLYALKWGVFVKWCVDLHIKPASCSV